MSKIVIIAIHGTFAQQAPWSQAGSAFHRRILSRMPQTDIEWVAMNWTGKNSHAAREAASLQLADLIKLHSADTAGSQLFIIAHSHGGNVALMTLAQFPALQRRVTGVVCLSTPFIQASAVDVQAFEADVREILTLPKIGFLTFVMYASLDFLNHKVPGVLEVGMAAYVVSLLFAGFTAAFAHGRLRKTDQTAILKTYNYNAIPVPILALRTTADEAFAWIRVNTSLAATGTAIAMVVMVLGLVAYALSIFGGVFWVVPLIVLGSMMYLGAKGLRALVRLGPWALGEGFVPGLLAHFHVSRHLGEVPRAIELQIPAPVGKTLGRLRIRHSFLYQSDEAASAITDFVRAQ